MKKNFGAKAWLYPMPVLIIGSYGADGTPDAMNAAWGGMGGGQGAKEGAAFKTGLALK